MSNYSEENFIADTGCSFPVVSDKIVTKLGIKIRPFENPINIIDGSGNSLQLLGSSILYVNSQVLGDRVEAVETAVLCNNEVDSELLLSLSILIAWDLVPHDFPRRTLTEHFNTIYRNLKNKSVKTKSVSSTVGEEKNGYDLPEPSNA